MKKLLRLLMIRDDKVFLYYLLLSFPYSILIVLMDNESCFSCFFSEEWWKQVLIVLSLLGMTLIIAYPTNIIYNYFTTISGRWDAFLSALVLGFIISFVLILLGLLYLWPVLVPTIFVIIMAHVIPPVHRFLERELN